MLLVVATVAPMSRGLDPVMPVQEMARRALAMVVAISAEEPMASVVEVSLATAAMARVAVAAIWSAAVGARLVTARKLPAAVIRTTATVAAARAQEIPRSLGTVRIQVMAQQIQRVVQPILSAEFREAAAAAQANMAVCYYQIPPAE